MRVQRRPVHRLIATAARPGGVTAAVPEAHLVADEDLPWGRGGSRWGIGWALRSPILSFCWTRSPSIVGRVVAPADRYGPQAFFVNVRSS